MLLMVGENWGGQRASRFYIRRMPAVRHRPLPALLLGLVALPYLMARAFPHECHSIISDEHGHEAAWLASHCGLCDLAMPVAERATSAQELAVIVQRAELAVLPVPMVPPHPHECLAARGPPRS